MLHLGPIEKSRLPLVIVVVVFVVLAVGGFFVWQRYFKLTPIEDFATARLSPKSDFRVEQRDGRNWVINDKAGLSFSVPGDWVLKEDVLANTAGIALYSPDAVIGDKEFIVTQGCKISSSVRDIRTEPNVLVKSIQTQKYLNPQNLLVQEETINGIPAVKQGFELPRVRMFVEGVHFVSEKVYDISLESFNDDKDRCHQEFSNVFPTVQITPKLF